LRIAVVAPLVTPLRPTPTGGSQAFLVDLARGLKRRGHDVLIYCAAPSDVPGLELVQVPVEAGLDRALVAMRGGTAHIPAMRDAFETLCSELRTRGADVVSQHAFDAEAIELAEGLPVVHTLHLPPIVAAVRAAALASKARFCAPSESARHEWLRAGLPDVALVPNGVPEWDPGRVETAPLALIAGRISPEKGVDVALRAAEAVGLRRLVVGPVYDREYFESAVRPLLGPGELLPAMPRERLWRVMARAAVFLAPVDWEEPYGLAAAEAQMAGCPVAGYRRGALPEIVEDGVSGRLAERGDFDGLVAGIREALGFDREEVRKSARRRLSLQRSLDAYEAALTEAVA
jgi:glycosyltransferase involved in cell wall biosynthesis